jgi:hypothetical protein
MKLFTLEDSRSPIVQRAAQQAIASQGSPSALAQVGAVWAWIRRHVRLVSDAELARLAGIEDPEEAEVLVRPVDILNMPQPMGDCDCQAMLGAAMLAALEIPSEFVTIAAAPDDPDRYSHVYVLAQLPGGRQVPLDFSHAPGPGWVALSLGKARVWYSPRVGLGAINIDWGGLIKTGVESTADILKARYAQPPVGTYIQKNGQVTYRQPAGASALAIPGVSASGSWLTIGAVLIVIVLLLAMMGKR